MKDEIAQFIDECGYSVVDIQNRLFSDDGELYSVFTVEVLDVVDDYAITIALEKRIMTELGLYDKKIILEIV